MVKKSFFSLFKRKNKTNSNKRKKKSNLKYTYKNGYLQNIKNTKGTKGKVYVVEDARSPYYKARYYNSDKSVGIKGKSQSGLAKKLAKKGHKEVDVWD